MFIFIVNVITILSGVALFFLAKSGIKHYFDLYQNESDTKNLTYIVNIAFLIMLIGNLISCTLMFTK